jgi:hypothetical protein
VGISTVTGGPPSSAMWASEYEIGGFRVASSGLPRQKQWASASPYIRKHEVHEIKRIRVRRSRACGPCGNVKNFSIDAKNLHV